ncbi:MBL fold metallo-hydrolase [Nanoarchaeota archaeon]
MEINIINEMLETYGMSLEEYNAFLEQMKADPIGFITEETDPDIGKKKNIFKSIHQIAMPYAEQGYILKKPKVDGLSLVFLGVGGGGQAVVQGHHTGGFILQSGDTRIHFDPGVTAVRDCLEYSQNAEDDWHPVMTDIICVTHNHIDHCGGLEEYAENIITVSKKFASQVTVLCNRTVLEGNKEFDQGPRLDKYKKAKLGTVKVMRPGDSHKAGEIIIKAVPAIHTESYDPESKSHSDSDCVGYVIDTPNGTVGVTGDTEFFPALSESFNGTDHIVAYMVQEKSRSKGEAERYEKENVSREKRVLHTQFLGEEGVLHLLAEVNPKTCILTHHGDQLVTYADGKQQYVDIPQTIAKRIESSSGVKTIAASDSMRVDIIEGSVKIRQNKSC